LTDDQPGVVAVDIDIEVTARGQLVEMMASHVRMKGEVIGHLGGGHALAFSSEQVDLARVLSPNAEVIAATVAEKPSSVPAGACDWRMSSPTPLWYRGLLCCRARRRYRPRT